MCTTMRFLSQITAVLLCSMVVSGTLCPEEEDLYPCRCQEEEGALIISCTGQGIRQLAIQNALSRINGVQIARLDLYHLQDLGKLKGDLFAGHDIRFIVFSSCDIEALTDGEKPAFSGLEDSLETLSIDNSLNGSPSLQLSHLVKLEKLLLYENQLQELNNVHLPASLEELDFSRNGIKSLPDHAFANLANLESLELDANELNTFRRSWLPVPSSKLWWLRLDNNNLTSLPRDAFSDMPSLEYVALEENGIRSMEQDVWEEVWQQLIEINIEENPLVCDTNMEWMRQSKHQPNLIGTCHVKLSDWIMKTSSE